MSLDIDWHSIRPLGGARDQGFEELCTQLARSEIPSEAQFIRKGTPDAGVECYAVFPDGAEWGWQAKYFDTMGSAQWTQIDKSVKTALEKHPRLVRYFVCVPLDLPDGRLPGQKSARKKWEESIEKWERLAAGNGMSVKFVYWGNSELVERLSRPEQIGRLQFWFDLPRFDPVWFHVRLEAAIDSAGPRYTPEIHVDLPLVQDFEAFGRTDRFFQREKNWGRSIRKVFNSLSAAADMDTEVDSGYSALKDKVLQALSQLGSIVEKPAGPLAFGHVVQSIEDALESAEGLSRLLLDRERDLDDSAQRQEESEQGSVYSKNPFRDHSSRLAGLISELRSAHWSLMKADSLATGSLMILRGDAGTGKTHLLCDVASSRIEAGNPTVLLMGQQFLTKEPPWVQALGQLGLPDLSIETFVGALEAAAQAANARALVMIDALNEGEGKVIWPMYLPAFLNYMRRSPWIGVVLSVRSSYEGVVIPEEVRSAAVTVTHHGFGDHEYDATRTFFLHYGLELPSTPLLAPEFRNPLFLKTLCSGLEKQGMRRLPRGFHGITQVFDFYLDAVNENLAVRLDFDKRKLLVRRALEAIAERIIDSSKRWIPIGEAQEVVDALLTGRGFEESLYRGLVAEGVLTEEGSLGGGHEEEIVFISYERFADHLVANALLNRHLDPEEPEVAFEQDGSLAFVCGTEGQYWQGLVEALCIQLPERIRRELPAVARGCLKNWGLGEAFRESLVWRAYEAFTSETRKVLNELVHSEYDLRDTLDALVTVATLPEHPLNARFLDGRLRQDSMPERDAWWAQYLHAAWGSHGPVRRLVDWAAAVGADHSIEEDTLDLCGLTLGWMFASSNRFLRDRATTALVALLTGRLDSAVRLVEHFADVDDLYVAERIYAVAYGVAMRSHDPVKVGVLAKTVYDDVFASASPPAHILLRDYARGVVERALYLGSDIQIDIELIRPPYRSDWPVIPSEKDIQQFKPDLSNVSGEESQQELGKHRIYYSVMADDFARYVIGTNSSSTSRTWLALRLDDPPWNPPPSPEELMDDLAAKLDKDERKVWDEYRMAEEACTGARWRLVISILDGKRGKSVSCVEAVSGEERVTDDLQKEIDRKVDELEKSREESLDKLKKTLSEAHWQQLEEILSYRKTNPDKPQPERLKLEWIQRYVLDRVFDLGWTSERFGEFDLQVDQGNGRQASKAERIGKKYQWIAYHEILALISDHFQYYEAYRQNGDSCYMGPWQDDLRDIDPSCTVRALPGGTSWEGHVPAWWGPVDYKDWGAPEYPEEWIGRGLDLPRIEDLLVVSNPKDGSRWVNARGYFEWQEKLSDGANLNEGERRGLWYLFTGYLICEGDRDLFLEWASGVDFWGRWMPEPPEVTQMFLGEHGWAPASRYFEQSYFDDSGWMRPRQDCPIEVNTIARKYLREKGGADCSLDDGISLHLPNPDLVTGLGARWAATGADFVNPEGQVVIQDPTAHEEGPTALLLREESLQNYLARNGLAVGWMVIGEKRVLTRGLGDGPNYPSLRISGAYVFDGGQAIGSRRLFFDDPGFIE